MSTSSSVPGLCVRLVTLTAWLVGIFLFSPSVSLVGGRYVRYLWSDRRTLRCESIALSAERLAGESIASNAKIGQSGKCPFVDWFVGRSVCCLNGRSDEKLTTLREGLARRQSSVLYGVSSGPELFDMEPFPDTASRFLQEVRIFFQYSALLRRAHKKSPHAVSTLLAFGCSV